MAKAREYGKDFVNLTVALSPEEHKRARLLSVEHGVGISDAIRMFLFDEKHWRAAAKAKAAAKKAAV